MSIRFCLLLTLVALLTACDFSREDAKYLDSKVEDLNFDVHEVEYSTTPRRFNVASYSHINRGSGNRVSELAEVKPVTSGAYGNWAWKIYADRQAFDFASSLTARQSVTVKGEKGPRQIILPSWNDAFTEFAKTAAIIFGARDLPLEVHITVVGEQANFSDFVIHDDDQHLILDYYFALDGSIPKDPTAEFQWLVDTVATAGHEFSHAFIHEQDVQLPDALTNEVMAYTMEQCVKVAVVGTQAGVSYLAPGGKQIDPGTLQFSDLVHTQGSASVDGYHLAEYDTVHALHASRIDRDDLRLRDKLLGLCVAQYQHINDFEKSFFPLADIQPVNYEWNSYQ